MPLKALLFRWAVDVVSPTVRDAHHGACQPCRVSFLAGPLGLLLRAEGAAVGLFLHGPASARMPQDTVAEINELVETSTLPVGLGVPQAQIA